MMRVAAMAPVTAAAVAEGWLTIATSARRLLPAPRAGGHCRGGSQGARWPHGCAGDISLLTPPYAAGETEARVGFASGLRHRRVFRTTELCQWVLGHGWSKAGQGHAARHTQMAPSLVTQALGCNREPKLSPGTQNAIPIALGWR